MNGDMYELIAIAMRYFFALLMALIAIRAIRITMVDSRRATDLRRMSPETGRCGEFVVVTGEGRAREGMRYPVIREGLVGSSRKADVRVRSRSIRRSHAFFELTERGLRVRSNNHAPMYVSGKSRREAMLRDGDHITMGHVELLLVLTVPVAAREDNEIPVENTADTLFDLRPEPAVSRTPAPEIKRREPLSDPQLTFHEPEFHSMDTARAYAGPFHTPVEKPAPAREYEAREREIDPIFKVKPAPESPTAHTMSDIDRAFPRRNNIPEEDTVDPLAPEPNDEFDRWLNSTDDDDDWDDIPQNTWEDDRDELPRRKAVKKRRPEADDPGNLFHI